MATPAHALFHRPIYLGASRRQAPEKLTEHKADFVQFAEKKLCERLHRIEQLEKDLDNLKDDRRACLTAIGCLVVTLGIVLYQWLVVCHGQAPGGF